MKRPDRVPVWIREALNLKKTIWRLQPSLGFVAIVCLTGLLGGLVGGCFQGVRSSDALATKTGLSSSAPNNSSTVGQPVTFTASVGTIQAFDGCGGGPVNFRPFTSGRLDFFVDQVRIGSFPAEFVQETVGGNLEFRSTVKLTTSTLGVGKHTITAAYKEQDLSILGCAFPGSDASLTFTVNPATVTHSLTVASSNPNSGVMITVSPADNGGLGNGTTPFMRTYNDGTAVTLTAPASAAGNNFSNWTGCDTTTGTPPTTCMVTMTADRTLTANYAPPPPVTHLLTVDSSNPNSGVTITVSPADNGGLANGTTSFMRTYNDKTTVTLTAPAAAGGNTISNWTGCDTTTGTPPTTCMVTMTADRTVTANYAPAQTVGLVQLVSENTSCTGGGSATSSNPTLSSDGHFVAFDSLAKDLVSMTLTQTIDSFRRDTSSLSPPTCPPVMLVVSVNDNNQEGNQQSSAASISGDGQVIVFASTATNLVASPPTSAQTGVQDYMRVLCVPTSLTCPSSTTTMVSVDSSGNIFGSTAGSAVSSDGRFVAFIGTTQTTLQVYLRDTCLHAAMGSCSPSTTLVSVGTNGMPANTGASVPTVSTGGHFVAFASTATNLAPGGTNGQDQVYVRDMTSNTTTLVSVDNNGVEGTSGDRPLPTISDDGRFVSFGSLSVLTANTQSNGKRNVYLRDACLGPDAPAGCVPQTILISVVDSTGMSANSGGLNQLHNLSSTGRFVAFTSVSSDLGVPPIAGSGGLVRDTCGGPNSVIPGCTPKTVLISVDSAGTALIGAQASAISGDGHLATIIIPNSAGTKADIGLALTSF